MGNRGKRTCLLLWKAIPAAYKKRIVLLLFGKPVPISAKPVPKSLRTINLLQVNPKPTQIMLNVSTALCDKG
jgi:hypothetical protein